MVLIRPIVPTDRALLNPGLARMSEQSRYLRFMGPVDAFSERELDYLTLVDHHDHEAILAFDATTGDGVGIARYVRTSRHTAEPAVSVADAWHGRGLGSELARCLAERAQDEGVRVFSAQTLAINEPSIRMLERLGRARRSSAGSAMQVRVRLENRRPPRRRASAWFRRTVLSGHLVRLRGVLGDQVLRLVKPPEDPVAQDVDTRSRRVVRVDPRCRTPS